MKIYIAGNDFIIESQDTTYSTYFRNVIIEKAFGEFSNVPFYYIKNVTGWSPTTLINVEDATNDTGLIYTEESFDTFYRDLLKRQKLAEDIDPLPESIEDQIVDGVVDRAPSQNIVYNALLGKLNTNLNNIATLTEDQKLAIRNKLGIVNTSGDSYTHPLSHPPSIISQNSLNRFVTDLEKAAWNDAVTKANALVTSVDSLETVPETFTSILTFDKNKFMETAVSQSTAISYTLAVSGNVDGAVIRHKILSDGVNIITFSADFNVFNESTNNIYPEGVHTLYFNYFGGEVDVEIPSYKGEVTIPDVTVPVFIATYPKLSSIGATSFNTEIQLDEIGTAYMVVLADEVTAPTSSEVKAGTASGGGAAIKTGTVVIAAASTTYTIATIGLDSDTAYDVYVVAEDDAENLQASPIKINIATAAAGYSIEAEQTFSYFTGTEELTNTEKNAIARFIDEQVRLGNWSKIKEIQLNSGVSTSAKALIGLKQGITGINNGATYAAATGFTTDGVATYVDTNMIPSTLITTASDVNFQTYMISAVGQFRVGAISSSPNANQLNFTYAPDTRTETAKIVTAGSVVTVLDAAYPKTNVFMGGFRKDANTIYNSYNASTVGNSVSTNGAITGLPNVSIYLGSIHYNGASGFGEASFGASVLSDFIGFNQAGFVFYFEQMMMELGVSTPDALHNTNPKPSYTPTDVLLLNSEGQSNSLFSGKPTNLNYAELTAPIVGANMYYMNPLGAALVKGDLEYMVNHTNDVDATGAAEFGGGLRLSQELVQLTDLDYHLWVYGKSGTALKVSAGKDWNVASTNELFYETTQLVGKKIFPLITEPIKKLVWHWNQGEGDTGSTEAEYTAQWYALLDAKISFMETEGFDFGVTDFHTIVAHIWSGMEATYAGTINVVNAQKNFTIAAFEAAYPSHVGKVKTMVTYSNDNIFRTDGVHMEAEGLHLEGYKVANYISKL